MSEQSPTRHVNAEDEKPATFGQVLSFVLSHGRTVATLVSGILAIIAAAVAFQVRMARLDCALLSHELKLVKFELRELVLQKSSLNKEKSEAIRRGSNDLEKTIETAIFSNEFAERDAVERQKIIVKQREGC